MSSCFEKCDTFARSKSARIFYGILLVLACCIGVIRLLELSNQMADQKLSHLELVVKPDSESLYYFKRSNDDSRAWSALIKQELETFLARFKYPHQKQQDCHDSNLSSEKMCNYDLNQLGPCSHENNYGIKGSTLCVFLKLREFSQWSPRLLNSSSLPVEMPHDLRTYIEHHADNNVTMAWTFCQGVNPEDMENIGPVSYFPGRGFPLNRTTFEPLQPLVAVFFEKPMKGIVINVQCKLWTHNSFDLVSFHIYLE